MFGQYPVLNVPEIIFNNALLQVQKRGPIGSFNSHTYPRLHDCILRQHRLSQDYEKIWKTGWLRALDGLNWTKQVLLSSSRLGADLRRIASHLCLRCCYGEHVYGHEPFVLMSVLTLQCSLPCNGCESIGFVYVGIIVYFPNLFLAALILSKNAYCWVIDNFVLHRIFCFVFIWFGGLSTM